MSWEEPPRRRTLTPLSGELRVEDSVRPPRRRLARLRRGSRAPRRGQTWRQALAWGLVRLGVSLAVGTALAVVAARLLDRPLAVGFYLAGAALLAVAFLSSAAASESAHPDGHTVAGGADGKELLVRRSLSYALVGFVLAGVGVLLETV